MQLNMGLELVQTQTQKLILTPELRQAITILQLPVMELEEYLQEVALENPLLEVEPPAQEELAVSLADYLAYLGEPPAGRPVHDDETPSFEAFALPVVTLHEHLRRQLGLLLTTAAEQRIGWFLIDSLDRQGYLTLSPGEAAAALAVPEAFVEQVLTVLQGCDPAGVGARSLEECLLLQWATIDDGNPLVPLIIKGHLADLAEGRQPRIAELLSVSVAEVQEAADLIRTLDPKPGRRFGQPGDLRYVVPDAAVERVGNGYVVITNDGPLPRLSISQSYRALLQHAEAQPFLEGRLQAALYLIRSIEQRRLTLARVIETIVELQRPFFDHGRRFLRPLVLREVADQIGVHESTVSRAVNGKYVQTPHGLFELKFFFSSGVEGVSSESVKQVLRDLIGAEDTKAPLSDQALTDLLRRRGLEISRRTVAKYREEMGVPSSTRRRRYG